MLRADPQVGQILWLERESGRHAGVGGVLRLATTLRQGPVTSGCGFCTAVLATCWRRGWPASPSDLGYGVGLQSLLLTVPVRLPPERRHAHPILRADALLDALEIVRTEPEPRLALVAEADRAMAARFATWPTPWIALGVGSSEAWKQWGAARFAELTLALNQRRAGSIFIVGGSAERPLAEEILARVRDGGGTAVDAVALPLEQVAALLARCRCYIGNDTGVLNMAAALQVPAIGLFGGSAPLWHSRFIHPLLPPAGEHGMAAITVSQVLEALARWSGPDVHHTLA
ncbi:MAG: glycosyltransferase family 9 protein [Candidatus Competibacteraceae bacterium]